MKIEKLRCKTCNERIPHILAGINARGEKYFRDDKGKRWYNRECGYCFCASQRKKTKAVKPRGSYEKEQYGREDLLKKEARRSARRAASA